MRRIGVMLLMVALGIGIGLWISAKLRPVEAQAKPGAGFSAVPDSLGSEDVQGPYEVVRNWPQDISTLPGNEKWTYGAGESVFAEEPTNRIYMLFRDELAEDEKPPRRSCSTGGPSLSYRWPLAVPPSTLPGTGGTDNNMKEWFTAWEARPYRPRH